MTSARYACQCGKSNCESCMSRLTRLESVIGDGLPVSIGYEIGQTPPPFIENGAQYIVRDGMIRVGDKCIAEVFNGRITRLMPDNQFAPGQALSRDGSQMRKLTIAEGGAEIDATRKPAQPVTGGLIAYFPDVHVYKVPTREEFEQWITQRGVFSLAKNSRGQYRNPYVRGAWAMRCAIITEFKP